MSTTIENRFGMPLPSKSYSTLAENVTLACNENGRYPNENLRVHHYESLPLDESADQCQAVVGPSSTLSGLAFPKTWSTLGHRNAMVKSTSLPSTDIVSHDPPDPFPELSNDRLAPVFARMYGTEGTMSLPTTPDKQTPGLPHMSSSDLPSVNCGIGRDSTSSACNNPSQDVMINVFVSEQKYYPVRIDGATTVADVCDQLSRLDRSQRDPLWTIVEHIDKFNIERSLEDHELLYPIYKSWHSASNHFYFRKDYCRYELYSNPTQCFPEQMLDVKLPKEEMNGFMTRNEQYRNLLLKCLLANHSIPDIQGYLHIRDGKKAWKKYFCVLRQSGLYYLTKGSVKGPNNMVLLTDLRNDNIYLALNAKKAFSAPTQHCFCLASSHDSGDKHQLKQFCAEDEQSRFCWVTGMRFVKYGSQLHENCRTSAPCETRQAENVDWIRNNSCGAANCVEAEFSCENQRQSVHSLVGVSCQENKNFKIDRCRCYISQPPPKSMTRLEESPTSQLDASFASATNSLRNLEWFHDSIGRDKAVTLICNCGLKDGTFLVRKSQTLSGVYVLSFAHNSTVKHCTIHRMKLEDAWYFSLDGGSTKFLDLAQLIDFYRLNIGRLPTRLTRHVSRLR